MYVVVTVSVFVLCLIVMDAALGALFGELLKAILLAKDKAIMFKETMDHLESTLKSIEPVIRKIEKHNKKLGRPKEELESLKTKMENGGTDDDSKINYRGWKVMPFIIGEQDYKRRVLCFSMIRFLVSFCP